MQYMWEQGSMIQLSWDTHTPKEPTSLSLLARWSWPFFYTSLHVHSPCLEMIQLDNLTKTKNLYLPKKGCNDPKQLTKMMRQVLELAGEKVARLHRWGQSHCFWQKCRAQPSYETSLIFILLTWPTANGVGLKKFDNFRTFTYAYWVFFSFRMVHWFDWFGWSTYSLVVFFQPTTIYRPCYFNPTLKEMKTKKSYLLFT